MSVDPDASRAAPRLTWRVKAVYALGDHTVNVVLTAMTLLYIRFLTDVVHFPASLAGAVPLLGRFVDAVTDPLMGRLSDLTRWRWGRRRPYMLLGCLPFGASFALMWLDPGLSGTGLRFAYYATVYIALSVSMTVVSIPYMALIPEMARDYDERTSLNTYRIAAGLLGIFVTISISLTANRLGDDAAAWAQAGTLFAFWITLPWLAVYAVTWERPLRSGYAELPLGEGLRLLARHRTYHHLCAIYIPGRIAIDLVSAMFFYYVAWVIGRRDDFEAVLATFVCVVVLTLPMWLQLSRRFDKRSIMLVGLLWWMGAQAVIYFGGPEWPRWAVFAVAGFAGVGYAVADMMPWAMLPDVIDEDELFTGERREGLYNGMFMFLRKVGGALAIFLMGIALDVAGYDGTRTTQDASAIEAIRWLMAVVPIVLLGLTAWIARRYPLSREVHELIASQLRVRNAGA